MIRRLTPLLLVLAVAGCQLAPDYKRPAPPVPTVWRTGEPATDSLASTAWWKLYRDPALVQLIGVALTNNFDARIAATRLEEAAAGYRGQRSALLPSLDIAADGQRARVGDLPPAPGVIGNQFNLFGLLSYEVDLWGRVHNLSAAARARYLATAEAQQTVQLSLVAAVAGTYFELRSLDEQLDIARHTLTSRERMYELTRVKFNDGNGIVSELDVRQAETQVHGARAAVARLERGVAQTENALSGLLGRNPGPIPRGQDLEHQPLPETLPAGLPSALLHRRPDIRAAEQALIAENANIGVARAAYFPTLSLTAALGLQSTELDNLFGNDVARSWKFAPRATLPVFNSGRVAASVAAARARQQAALLAYEQTVQNAFREVDDALIAVAKLHEQMQAEAANAAAEGARLELSELRYDGGVAPFSEVLDAQRFLFNAELQLAQTRRDHLVALVQLYKALGGGWSAADAKGGMSRPR